MAKQSNGVMAVITWLVGVLVSLTVGSAMATGQLVIGQVASPVIPVVVTQVAGWVVVVGTVIGVVMALFSK